MQKHNFHTHSLFSDGHNTPEEMITSAIALGFESLGLSDHSYGAGMEDYCMKKSAEPLCIKEIERLKREYAGRLRVFGGIELDADSPLPEFDYDYVITSVHESVRDGVVIHLDSSPAEQTEIINTRFGGDKAKFARAYYKKVAESVKKRRTDIIGHFDLITKYSLIDEDESQYIDAALECVAECVKHCRLFELNTGAIARGLRKTPYPAPFILREIKKCGGWMILTSDCHYREKLTVWFDEAEQYLRGAGFEPDENGCINDKIRGVRIWK